MQQLQLQEAQQLPQQGPESQPQVQQQLGVSQQQESVMVFTSVNEA